MARQEAVVAIVENKDDVLLVKKIDLPGHWFSGKWHIPGETLEDEKTDEQGLHRGIREETGIEIVIVRYLALHTSPTGKQVRWYMAEAVTNELRPGSDVVDAKWTPRNEVPGKYPEAVSLWPLEVRRYFGLID